jgi:putative radical SAM enzyme (TIGR03279 family)
LHGNYVTLTNLSAKDLDRIIEQRLSPLYVSVHTTDSGLRTRILGRKKADDLEGKLKMLTEGGIRLHAQIVLIPGINDGKHLEKTLFDLYRLYPGVQSVAIVPLGLSGHGTPKDRFAPVTPEFSRRLIRQVIHWQEVFRRQTGRTFAYLGDEFYIQGGESVPGKPYYDDFAQIEDGVGMARVFLDDFETELRRRKRSNMSLRGTLVTGRLFYPLLCECIERFNRRFVSALNVCRTENRFMGRRITVAGLLSGRDILRAIKGRDSGDFIIIPSEAISRTEGVLVDDLSLSDLSERLGKPVYPGGRTVSEFFRLLWRRSAVSD